MKLNYLAPVSAVFVLAVGFAGQIASGRIYSGLHAREMIDALTSPALYLGSAIATSSATTMALMLTVLGLVRRMDADFDHSTYKNVYRISLLSAVLLVGSVVMLLMMSMPIGEFEEVPEAWYPALYKALYWLVVGLSALLVAVITLLFSTIRTLITNITPDDMV